MKTRRALIALICFFPSLSLRGLAVDNYAVKKEVVEGHTTYHLLDSKLKMDVGIVPDVGNLKQPLHGLLIYETRWKVVQTGSSNLEGAFVVSRLEFYKYPKTLICAEPQTGPTNALNLQHQGKFKNLIILGPGRTFEGSFWIVPLGF
jgi:galactose mutarotase-like enzyme